MAKFATYASGRHLVDNFATYANGAIWVTILQVMQVAPSGGQICNHLVAITCWPNLEPMQVTLYLAGEITQVKESIPWVRCASGNVL